MMFLNMLWIGDRLGTLERACMRSVLRQDHRLRLWCYDPPAGLPDGVTVADAAEILPRAAIVHHRSGSVSLFSNHFRYALQRRALGIWIDSDVYLLRPIDLDRPYLLTEYEPGRINGGILRMPADSPALDPLFALFDERSVPPWLPLRARLAARWRLLRTGRTGIADMPWGSCGPLALTAVAARFDLLGLADPAEIYSPVPWQRAEWIADPAASLDQWTSPRTRAVHLWNERIKHVKDHPAPPGSFLARLQAEGA